MCFSRWLIAAWALAAASGACAQETASAYDPNQLPAYHGQLQLFTLTPRADIDGFVLTDGTEVKTPPHLSTQIAMILRLGDNVTIHGLKAAKLPLIQAVSVTNDRDHASVVDNGPALAPPGGGGDAAQGRTISGKVRMPLHGPRGEVNGALLADGTILRLPPPDVEKFAGLLSPGQGLSAEGMTHVTAVGTVVEVTSLGVSPDKLQPVE